MKGRLAARKVAFADRTLFGYIKPCGNVDELWQQCTVDALMQMG